MSKTNLVVERQDFAAGNLVNRLLGRMELDTFEDTTLGTEDWLCGVNETAGEHRVVVRMMDLVVNTGAIVPLIRFCYNHEIELRIDLVEKCPHFQQVIADAFEHAGLRREHARTILDNLFLADGPVVTSTWPSPEAE